MAISRIGGTHGLLKGSVGDDTYLIVKSPSGSYTQIVQQKKTTHTDTKTERLAVQQMCTAIVEAMMRDLKSIIKVSFQSAKNKTASVNMFSNFALRSLANDCKNYWFQDGDFYYPDAGSKTPVAGPFILSSGTLPYNSFSEVLSAHQYVDNLPVSLKPSEHVFMNGGVVVFKTGDADKSIGDFMARNRLQYTTQVFVAFFTEKIDADTEKVYNRYRYAMISLNPRVRKDEPISIESLKALFVVQQADDYGLVVNDKNLDVIAGAMWDDRILETDIVSIAAFTRDNYQGKTLIHDSKFMPTSGRQWPYYHQNMPAVQLWSWMGARPGTIYDYPW